jgi:hypothetical protein
MFGDRRKRQRMLNRAQDVDLRVELALAHVYLVTSRTSSIKNEVALPLSSFAMKMIVIWCPANLVKSKVFLPYAAASRFENVLPSSSSIDLAAKIPSKRIEFMSGGYLVRRDPKPETELRRFYRTGDGYDLPKSIGVSGPSATKPRFPFPRMGRFTI